ncbi:hypothetical protein AVEN_2849-1 [Araneus ventricosus]|uniref:Uncharacterized protein n=1 Tax=Araneus ventricosus TaxID=182803 RepID=A0A4Y2DUY7_ARAVE|nr:hypothetical protein AVEN_2849-1 [Araneus ventricosus]
MATFYSSNFSKSFMAANHQIRMIRFEFPNINAGIKASVYCHDCIPLFCHHSLFYLNPLFPLSELKTWRRHKDGNLSFYFKEIDPNTKRNCKNNDIRKRNHEAI